MLAHPALTGWANLWRASGAGWQGLKDSSSALAIFGRISTEPPETVKNQPTIVKSS